VTVHSIPIPAAAAGRAPVQLPVLVHQLHFVIQQAFRNTVAVVIVAIGVGVVIVPHIGWVRFAAWAAGTLAAYGIRAILLWPGMRIEVIGKNPDRWVALLFGSTLISGIIGASAPFVFFPSLEPIEQMFLSMIICLWVTGAMASIGAYHVLYTGYVCVFIGELILAWLMTADAHPPFLAVLFAFYGLIIIGFGRSFAREVTTGVAIRFENQALVAELDAARRAAEAANDAKSRFLAAASHDLRQPLHTLTMLSGLLNRYARADKIGEIAQQIDRSVGALDVLFSSILDLSRLEVGALRPELCSVPLKPMIARLEAEYGARAQAKGLQFRAHSDDVAIVTDPVLLERMLRNLTDNAIKYCARGSVELICEAHSDAVIVRVADTGPGIRPEDCEAVFGEFFRAHDVRRSNEGLGLGLAIVKRLSDLLGYGIELQSEVGVGSTFKLVIPGTSITTDDPGIVGESRKTAEISLDGLAIVYIDDDTQIHAVMHLLLSEWGCQVVTASTLDEARARMRERGMRPDAILSDYALADNITGIDVIEALRQDYGGLPAAIITGESSPELREKLRHLEYPVLFKPTQPEELRRLLAIFRSIA
jgi:signal transduction histidine kinase/CheY-like chemotaxis protein